MTDDSPIQLLRRQLEGARLRLLMELCAGDLTVPMPDLSLMGMLADCQLCLFAVADVEKHHAGPPIPRHARARSNLDGID